MSGVGVGTVSHSLRFPVHFTILYLYLGGGSVYLFLVEADQMGGWESAGWVV
jgi:hypothetical protein